MASEAGCSSWDAEMVDEEEEEEEQEEGDFTNSNLMQPFSSLSSSSSPFLLQGAPKISRALCAAEQSPSREALSWQWMPDLVVIKLLSHLGDTDRCNASLTCSSWRRAFRTPSLWRRRYFFFRGFDAVKKSECYNKFLLQLGSHVQHVSVELSRPNINTASVIAKAFDLFVTHLNKCPGLRLLSFRVVNADFYSGWQFFSHNRTMVTRSLCGLLKKQACLRSADLSFCLMDRDEGSRLLDALAHGSRLHPKKFLSRLDLRQFFSPRTRVVSFSRFFKVMGQFMALTSIRIDLRSLNEPILQRLTRASAKSIRCIELDFYADESVGSHAIRSGCWRDVVQRSPCLTLVLRIHGLCRFHKYGSVLVQGMPLSELKVTYLGVENLADPSLLSSINLLILHLAQTFHHTLTRLSVHLRPDIDVTADKAMVSLVKRCLHLRDLSVNFAIEANTVVEILNIIQRTWVPTGPSARKTRFHLNVRGMTPELDRSIRLMTSSGNSDVSATTVPASS